MPKIAKCKVITVVHDVMDFKGDDGAQVHLERTEARVFLPDATFPEKVMLRGLLPIGEGTIELHVDVKKDVLRCMLDVDTFQLAAVPPPVPATGGKN